MRRNRCTSGCEAGVGIYKSKDGGEHWEKLADKCVSNATYPCVDPGNDAFLGRGINSIVVDPRNSSHILVGSAQAVRGLSHVIGAGGTLALRAGRERARRLRVDRRRRDLHEVWNGTKPDCRELVRHHRPSALDRSTRASSTRRLRRRRLAA